ncbi:hypothetical protein [Brevundimonas vesicularis]|uniref:hypothetical protein n=1 Tax=Brevundimonas vesicularis TaxID=41276 RepID=UPI0038D3CFB1
MPFDFLTPRIDRLNADGSTVMVHPGTVVGRLMRRPVLLIARELCSFSLFTTSNLPRSRRQQAALLHARMSAPYSRSGWQVSKTQDDYGIWWWDADRIAAVADAAGRWGSKPIPCPETLMQPAAPTRNETWRIVRLAQGYEAQLWQHKALVASAWRPDRYDVASWASFARLQRHSEAAPATPPAPVDLPIVYDARRAQAPLELSREKVTLWAAGGTITACLCLAAYLSGQTWQLGKDVEQVKAETVQIRAATPRPTMVSDLGDAQEMLMAYKALEEQTSPLSAAGAAIGILAYHEITPSAVEAEAEALRMVVHYGALDRLEAVTEDLQNSGYFFDIRPRTDANGLTITLEMKVREAAPPLQAEG